MIKILPSQYFPNIGLCIHGIDDCLPETMAFPAVDITGIFAIRTFVDRIKIVRSKASGG